MESSDITLIPPINFCLFGGLSIIFNTTLIYVLLKRSLTSIGTYKYLMITSSSLDALYSFTTIFALPVSLQFFLLTCLCKDFSSLAYFQSSAEYNYFLNCHACFSGRVWRSGWRRHRDTQME
uniref:G_PROTEIN_RECEP_F1_2 domain-containing protein n=1 Tax=Angiostrongylus cantonensis TaxID=6313 RepID=A0A0K0DKX4_ANGCA